MVTEPAIVCVPVGLAVTVPAISPKVTGASENVTVCVAGKFRIEVEPVITAVPNVTDGVPLIEAVTAPLIDCTPFESTAIG